MTSARFRAGLGLGLVIAVEAFSGQALAQSAPSGSVKPAASVPAPAPAPTPKAPGAPAPAPKAAPVATSSAPAAPVSGPVNVSAPDVVRLKNGGILRGTISELVPGDYVSIVLITGEPRKVPYADVQFAGPTNEAAATVAPAPARTPDAGAATAVAPASGAMSSNKAAETQPFTVVHAQESRVDVTAKQQGLTLFRRSASAGVNGVGFVNGYDEVCTAPCNVSIPAGTHTFAVAKSGGKPREADAVSLPAGKANMSIAYADRTVLRAGLGLLGLAGAIAGIAMVAGSDSTDSVAGPIVLAGLGGGLFGLAFTLPDGSKITVSQGPGSINPANNPSLGSTRSLDQRPRDANALRNGLSGLTLTAHF